MILLRPLKPLYSVQCIERDMRRGRARPATCGSTATAPLAREQHSRHGLCSDKSRIGPRAHRGVGESPRSSPASPSGLCSGRARARHEKTRPATQAVPRRRAARDAARAPAPIRRPPSTSTRRKERSLHTSARRRAPAQQSTAAASARRTFCFKACEARSAPRWSCASRAMQGVRRARAPMAGRRLGAGAGAGAP